jgi:hypothetical protein
MKMGALFRGIALMMALVGSGCVWSHEKIPKAEPIKFPTAAAPVSANRQPLPLGRIRVVNDAAHFVLVETDGFIPPDKGTTLKCFRDGVEVGILTAGAEQRRQFFTADIVKGDLQRGDRVMR